MPDMSIGGGIVTGMTVGSEIASSAGTFLGNWVYYERRNRWGHWHPDDLEHYNVKDHTCVKCEETVPKALRIVTKISGKFGDR